METAVQNLNEAEVTFEYQVESPAMTNLARFYFASFWTVVFTGAVRKWLFPHQQIFYILQDIPITLGYFYAVRKGLFDKGPMLLGFCILSVVLMLQGFAQIMVLGLDWTIAVVGFHHYLYYLPILFTFPYCLTERYRRNLIRLNLLFAIPVALLSIAQARSPTNSFINRTSEGDAMGLPGVEVARVSGTFNFVTFYGLWLGIAFALCMGEWLVRKDRRVFGNRWILILSTFCLTLCVLVSGSRQTIFLSASALLGALLAAFVLRSNRAILAIGGILFLVPVVGVCTYFISPSEFDTVSSRLVGERESADAKGRITSGFYAFITEPKFSLIGAGIGLGVDAAHVGSSNAYQFTYALSEGDTPRNVMELGTPVGIFYICVRFGWILGMILLAVRIVRDSSSPHVLPLSFILGAQAFAELTRSATMTSTQVMLGYAFILGVQRFPDQWSLEQWSWNYRGAMN